MVSYVHEVPGDVFKALADASRRALLDRLRDRDGQDVTELAAALLPMTRFGVAKHLGVLVEAGLVTVVADGRHRRHHLNPVPLQELHARWLSSFAATGAQALLDLRTHLEQETSMTAATTETPETPSATVFTIVIRTSAQRLWDALTETGVPRSWLYEAVARSSWEPGSAYAMGVPGFDLMSGTVVTAEPPRLLVLTFDAHWDDEVDPEPAGRLEYAIEEQDDVCRLTVTLDGLAPATARSVAADTPEIYSALKTVLETGSPLRGA